MTQHEKKKRKVLWAFRALRARVNRRVICRGTTVIAITGSCAKTSTTSFLGKIISDVESCFVGVGSNTWTPILRNVLALKRGSRFFIHEAGARTPGDMKGLAALLYPDVAVVTTIGLDHYTAFRTHDAVAEEKGRLVEALSKGGVAVLNADDPHVLAMAERTRARVLTYGLSPVADVRGSEVQSCWPDRLSLTVTYQGESVHIQTQLFGDLLVTAVLAAIAAALAAGFDLQQCAQSMTSIEAFDRRMSIHRTAQGVWFVNDTRKAPYWSVEKVVALLKNTKAPRKTLVFGSFSDTPGSDSRKYRSTAIDALGLADRVVFVGKKAAYVHKLFSSETEGRLFAFDSPQEACRMLAETAVADELIMIKSNSMERLDRLIYGQDVELNCWKETCSELKSCEKCENGGLLSIEGGGSNGRRYFGHPFDPTMRRFRQSGCCLNSFPPCISAIFPFVRQT